jgi:hypothetical protein
MRTFASCTESPDRSPGSGARAAVEGPARARARLNARERVGTTSGHPAASPRRSQLIAS